MNGIKRKKSLPKLILSLLLSVSLIISLLLAGGCSFLFDSEPKQSGKKATIDEELLFEWNDVSVTAKSIEYSITGAELKLTVENNSNKDYSLRIEEVIVNDCMIPSLFVCDVDAGMKANDTIDLYARMLKDGGISNIGKIEIYFYIIDSSYRRVYTPKCVTIETSLYDDMDDSADKSGHEIYDDNGIRIIGRYQENDTIFGKSLVLYIENTTDDRIVVDCYGFAINGYTMSELMISTVYPGKYAIEEMTIFDNSLEENDISKIEEFTISLEISNADTYRTIDKTGPVTFSK